MHFSEPSSFCSGIGQTFGKFPSFPSGLGILDSSILVRVYQSWLTWFSFFLYGLSIIKMLICYHFNFNSGPDFLLQYGGLYDLGGSYSLVSSSFLLCSLILISPVWSDQFQVKLIFLCWSFLEMSSIILALNFFLLLVFLEQFSLLFLKTAHCVLKTPDAQKKSLRASVRFLSY